MEENSDDDLNCNLGININLSQQRQLLESLKNKYKVETNKPTSTNRRAKKSQPSALLNSVSISQSSSSSSSNPTSQQSIESIKANSNNKKSTKASTKTKASLYENVTVIIDFKLLENYGEQILNELDTLEIKYELKNQVYSNLVTWHCKGDELDDESHREFETVLFILSWKDVVDYVNSSSFVQYISSLSEVLTGKRITLGLCGLGNYFKYWKTYKQSSKQGKNTDKNGLDYKSSVKISRHQLEYALTELELKHSCCHRFLESTQDLSQVICQYTKAVAQLPEKLQKNKRYKNIDFCLVKDNKDCVLIDKNGNGSRRLWQQQLTTFDLVRLETAEAIISKYPTPTHLFEVYKRCSKTDGLKLLEDIQIRRAAGPLTTSRRIGPELSNKIYNFFNATDGNTLI
ncbi:hypothetical protein AMK59_4179 [Oryctes borbonicus]|uniref:Uncharacterized protein n=1 Tax=Oryctes borbonicus TaxID=1629725 RepID=A0A0T6B848_9SCAR|nr:hypothetical protein AMK59_4179 [Oryctes borbonicus]